MLCHVSESLSENPKLIKANSIDSMLIIIIIVINVCFMHGGTLVKFYSLMEVLNQAFSSMSLLKCYIISASQNVNRNL